MKNLPGNLQSTIFAIIFSVSFLLYLNGEIGSVLLYIIGGASIISCVILCVSKKHFTVSLSGSSGVSEFGRKAEFEVTLNKNGFCFIPYIEVFVDAEESIVIRTSLLFRNSVTVKGYFIPKHSGLTHIEIVKTDVWDILRNFRFAVKTKAQSQLAVLPKVVKYDGPEIMPNMLPSEEEETEEGMSVSIGGMPGYEHREYVPGDSPRRVNYKLSAKRRKLMVRLDESNGYAATNLLIADNGMSSCCDKAFALAKSLVERGGTVRITHSGESCAASTPETLDKLREWMAFHSYAIELVPSEIQQTEGTDVTFFGDGEIIVHS